MLRAPDPLRLVALLLIAGGAIAWMRSSSADAGARQSCGVDAPGCSTAETLPPPAALPPALSASDFCSDVGYLCAPLAEQDVVRMRRWTAVEGPMIVHVPQPDELTSAEARTLQRAAAQGIRAWNNQPFPILVDLRGDRDPHFSVQWTRRLGGPQLGVARTRWSLETGLRVESIELGTAHLSDPRRTADPRQVRLTAAHEMGHALGLPHSDSPRDVMYPTNTASSMSAQDYRSIEVLYDLEDGTSITR